MIIIIVLLLVSLLLQCPTYKVAIWSELVIIWKGACGASNLQTIYKTLVALLDKYKFTNHDNDIYQSSYFLTIYLEHIIVILYLA